MSDDGLGTPPRYVKEDKCRACYGTGLYGYEPQGDGLYKAAKPCPVCMGVGKNA